MSADRQIHRYTDTHTSINVLQLVSPQGTFQYKITNIGILNHEVKAELNKLDIWFRANKLSLNVSKTHFMVLTNINITEPVRISIRQQPMICYDSDPKLKDNKSPGIYGITPKLLKEIAEEISVPLAIMLNLSLREGTVPIFIVIFLCSHFDKCWLYANRWIPCHQCTKRLRTVQVLYCNVLKWYSCITYICVSIISGMLNVLHY